MIRSTYAGLALFAMRVQRHRLAWMGMALLLVYGLGVGCDDFNPDSPGCKPVPD